MEKNFKDAVSDKLCDFINSKKLTSRQMYETIGCPTINLNFSQSRFYYGGSLEALCSLAREGRIVLFDSSWGEIEATSDECKGKKPSVDDISPKCCGGSPCYKYTFNKESVVVEASFYYEDVDDWSDYINVKRIWQHRTFVFKPIDGDESSLDSILDVFWKWIGDRFFDWSLDKILNEQAERFVSNFMKENFENE